MANEITVGTMAVAKVGRNEIPVEVIAVENGIYTVKNRAGKDNSLPALFFICNIFHIFIPYKKKYYLL